MATAFHVEHESKINQSDSIAEGYKFGIVVSEWNSNITGALRDGAIKTLLMHGVKESDIMVETVPGSFELTYAASLMMQQMPVDAIIVLGCRCHYRIRQRGARRYPSFRLCLSGRNPRHHTT